MKVVDVTFTTRYWNGKSNKKKATLAAAATAQETRKRKAYEKAFTFPTNAYATAAFESHGAWGMEIQTILRQLADDKKENEENEFDHSWQFAKQHVSRGIVMANAQYLYKVRHGGAMPISTRSHTKEEVSNE